MLCKDLRRMCRARMMMMPLCKSNYRWDGYWCSESTIGTTEYLYLLPCVVGGWGIVLV